MRCQRINFCDVNQRCDKRRTNRTPGTYQVAVIKRFAHQLMRNVVQNSKTVVNDRIEFGFNTLGNNFRQFINVPFMRFIVNHFRQRFYRARYGRRIKLVTVRHRFYFINHIRNFIGVGYAYFISNIFAEVFKLCQHFFRCAVIQRRLFFCIFPMLYSMQNCAVFAVLRV